jgi:hypothetical protein
MVPYLSESKEGYGMKLDIAKYGKSSVTLRIIIHTNQTLFMHKVESPKHA